MFGVALALVPLLLFTYFGLSTRLLADDYAYLGLANRIGTWEAMLAWRGAWNGGYSNFLTYGLLAPLGKTAPPLLSLLILASGLGAYSWLTNTALACLGIGLERWTIAASLAALAVAATINGFYVAQAFYWFAAAMIYTWPAVMFLLGIALAAETARRLRGNLRHLLAALATAVYAFLNAGYSELSLIFQLSAMALIVGFVFLFQSGAKVKTYRILVLAACLGTLAGFALQVSAPGFANRSSVPVNDGHLVTPVRELSQLIGRTLDLTMFYAGNQSSFAGFMLVAFSGMFLALLASQRIPPDPRALRRPISNAPVAIALILQFLFLPVLWTHSSDNIEALGRFSYAFLMVVVINLLLILVLLPLLWRRRLGRLLARRNGLVMYCSCVLLAVCLLFMMTQIRSIHYKGSAFLVFTAASMLIMLASQLTSIVGEPRQYALFQVSVYISVGAAIILATLLAVKMFGAGYVVERTLTSAVLAQILAGIMIGITLGACIRRGFCLAGAKPVWTRSLRLFCLLAALTIGLGMTIGQAQQIGLFIKDVEHWESQHQEIIQLRDAGDPAVYTRNFRRLRANYVGETPRKYKQAPLDWRHMLFYGLDMSESNDDCSVTNVMYSSSPRVRIVCLVIAKGNGS